MAHELPLIGFSLTPDAFLRAVVMERLGLGELLLAPDAEASPARARLDADTVDAEELWLHYRCEFRVHPSLADARLERRFQSLLALALRRGEPAAVRHCRDACLAALDHGLGPVLAGVLAPGQLLLDLADQVATEVRDSARRLAARRVPLPAGGHAVTARWQGPHDQAVLVARCLASHYPGDDVIVLSAGKAITVRPRPTQTVAEPAAPASSRPRRRGTWAAGPAAAA